MSATGSISTLEGDASFTAYCARPDREPRTATFFAEHLG